MADEPKPTRNYLQRLRDGLGGLVKGGKLTQEDADALVRTARGAAGGLATAANRRAAQQTRIDLGEHGGHGHRAYVDGNGAGRTLDDDSGHHHALKDWKCEECAASPAHMHPMPDMGAMKKKASEGSDELAEAAASDGWLRLFSANDFAEPPERINVLPLPGEYKHPQYGTIKITKARNARFVDNFGVYQDKIPLDFEHDTKMSGAVGWITELEQNKDGSVDALVDWTDRGRSAIEEDRFKYFSPEWYDSWKDPVTEKVYKDVLIGGALTTRPFFKDSALRPLVASEHGAVLHVRNDELSTEADIVFEPMVADEPRRVPTTLAAYFESTIHGSFTNAADTLRRVNYVSQEERIALSNAIGEALKTFGATADADLLARTIQVNEPWMYAEPKVAAVWTTAKQNDLPDSSFLYLSPGGEKDEDGKTTPRTLRHWPYKDADGKVDLPHLRNALARIPQTQDVPAQAKASAISRARKILEDLREGGAEGASEALAEVDEAERQLASQPDVGDVHVPRLRPAGQLDQDKRKGAEMADDDAKKLTEEVSALTTRLTEAEAKIAAAETTTAAEKAAREAAEARVKGLEDTARARRFADVVQGAPDGYRWYGPVDKHVKTLARMAEAFGEDSDEFKDYVENQRTLATQLHQSELFREIGSTQADESGDGEYAKAVKTYREAHPDKSEAEASVAVMEAQPKLYSEYVRAQNRRIKRGDDDT